MTGPVRILSWNVNGLRACAGKGFGDCTWWSQRFGVRARNVGWRIDYVMAFPAALSYVRGAFIQPGVRGSDHCPVGVTVDPAIFGGGGSRVR